MNSTNAKKSNARQRLIETAERLFYAEGIHAVGIDRIIAEAEVAKMTLYNHFASKDELILAVLQYREEQVSEMFTKSIERHVRKGSSRLNAFFVTLKNWFQGAGFRGCSFINTTVELADSSHPASLFAAAHKKRLHGMIREFVIESGGKKAEAMVPAIALLVEGAIVMAVMHQSAKPADVARDATLALISQVSLESLP